MAPRVSILTATRDYGQYIAEAIQSVQKQSFQNWEMIIVDDGSRDHTAAIIRRFQEDPRIRLYRCEGVGASRARNLAWHFARGDFIAQLDGDDLWLPSKLERQIRLMDTDPGIGVSFTRRMLIDPEGGLQSETPARLNHALSAGDILIRNPICFSSSMVRRNALEHLGIFNPHLELAIDYELWVRLAQYYRFDFIDEALVKYRTGHANLSRRIVARIHTVLSIMRRTVRLSRSAQIVTEDWQQAWASTCRTMAYVLRENQPLLASSWYMRAGRYDGNWWQSLRSLLYCLRKCLQRKVARTPLR